MKILNLYACLGGNRFKWNEVKEDIEVTAIELDPELAKLYQERFPNDKVIVADAHQYLLEHYKEFDFIWSSPPCPTHSKARFARRNTTEAKYPDLKLYEEIPAHKRGRHLYWTNFNLPNNLNDRSFKIGTEKKELDELCKFHDYNFRQYKGLQSVQKIARNLVDYEAGKTIFETALNIQKANNSNQLTLI